MAGRTISDIYDWRPRAYGRPALEIDALEGPGLRQPVSLTAREGEIIGFFGLVGAGRSELFRLIYGAAPATGGTVRVHGKTLPAADPRRAIAAGLALCPEDRKDEGIVPQAGVSENITIARRNLLGRFFTDQAAEARQSEALIGLMRVKTASPGHPIATLSGGNQQKAIIARWLAAESRVLLMDEPTRGIDVGARSEIYGHIYRLAEEGRTILFASSDLPEVMGVADRIIVMCEGRVVAIVERGDAAADDLLRLALPESGRDQAA
jgi:L-arabinose transport system ATP-binding protein